jgi:pimeloyl-ACP methyl ester carboxylesterase
MPYFRTQDGCSLYYETQGFTSAKPVVVFLNGTMLTTVYWKPQADSLKDRFRVILYDARGQGKSDLGERGLSLGGHVEDFGGLLDHLGVENAHLVGLSHGAQVEVAYAAQSPERVQRLVLCSVSAAPSSRARLIVRSWLETLEVSGLEAMVRAALPVVFGEDFLRHQERILDTMVKAIVKRNTKEALFAQLQAMTIYSPPSEMAPKIRMPCLVISGSDDPIVTEEGARKLAELCNGTHEHLAGIGHSIPSEAPELFGKMVKEFLEKT